jgi:hypothetical protein
MFRYKTSIIAAWLFFVAASGLSAEPQYDPVSMDPPSPDTTYPPDFHELLMPSHGNIISGFMLGANGAGPHPTALLIHGFPGNEKNLDLAQSLRRAGYNVLFFIQR